MTLSRMNALYLLWEERRADELAGLMGTDDKAFVHFLQAAYDLGAEAAKEEAATDED